MVLAEHERQRGLCPRNVRGGGGYALREKTQNLHYFSEKDITQGVWWLERINTKDVFSHQGNDRWHPSGIFFFGGGGGGQQFFQDERRIVCHGALKLWVPLGNPFSKLLGEKLKGSGQVTDL